MRFQKAVLVAAESEFEGDNPSGQPFDTLMRSISETISEQGLSNEVIVEHDPNWITINISSTMLFAPNSSSILTRSRPVIASIANTLKSVNNYIRVRGYTDNSFVPSAIYGNNWELSSRRAINVLQELEANGIDPQRLAAEAYGQYSPFYSNATRAGRAQNRRVVIAISREALKNQNLQVVPGSSENMIPTRRAGSGGFNFEANPDGSVSFKADPIDQDTGVMVEEAPPAEGDAGAGRVELPNFLSSELIYTLIISLIKGAVARQRLFVFLWPQKFAKPKHRQTLMALWQGLSSPQDRP